MDLADPALGQSRFLHDLPDARSTIWLILQVTDLTREEF